MGLFQKREVIFQEKDKPAYQRVMEALKSAGISAKGSSYESEPPVCGCGAKLDPRDFGAKGKVDRSVYVIRVPEAEAARAREILAIMNKEK